MNLFAYTELYYKTYPAYVSLNRNNYDTPVLSLRSRDAMNASYIEMPDSELRKLRDSITAYLDRKAEE